MFLGVFAFAILFLLPEAAPHNRKMARIFFEDRWLPKSILCLRDYNANKFLHDLIAGITVGLVALPLAQEPIWRPPSLAKSGPRFPLQPRENAAGIACWSGRFPRSILAYRNTA